jgi:hypothetical protein
MKAIKIIMIILLAVAACACIVPEEPEIPTPTPTPTQTPAMPQSIADLIPRENLPGTFKLIAMIDENTTGSMNITEDALSTIAGNLSVGEIKAVQGVYTSEGGSDVFVTIIECTDSMNAANAVENYKNQPDFENPPSRTVSRFGTVTFNEHEATEVRRKPPLGSDGIRYGYIWSNDNRVFIVEPGPGADDKQANMELAAMTGY